MALQREVDIELKIQEGLEKLTKAKSKSKQKDAGISSQLEKNNKRLDFLKHEIQKRNMQLQALQNSPKAADPIQQKLSRKKLVPKLSSAGIGKAESVTELSGMDTGLLRVVVVDPATKSEFKKAVFITENQSTVEVIEMILSKANFNVVPNQFQLSYKLPDKGKPNLMRCQSIFERRRPANAIGRNRLCRHLVFFNSIRV